MNDKTFSTISLRGQSLETSNLSRPQQLFASDLLVQDNVPCITHCDERPTMNSETILVCTVGGSHAPILAAIKHHAPSSIHFVCSSGKRSSAVQITGVGNCIKASPRDEKPTLPNIPAQLKLRDDQYEVIEVPADDPDAIHQRTSDPF